MKRKFLVVLASILAFPIPVIQHIAFRNIGITRRTNHRLSTLSIFVAIGFLAGFFGVVAPVASAAKFHCPEKDIAATGCRGPRDCLYPNPANCSSYIQCTINPDGITGTPVVMPCAQGHDGPLEWNDHKKQCDHPGAPGTC